MADPSLTIRYRGLGTPFNRFITLIIAFVASAFALSFFAWLVSNVVTSDTLHKDPFSQTWLLAWLFAIVALGNELIRTPLIFTLAYTAVTSTKPVPVVAHAPLRGVMMIPFVPASEDPARLELSLIAFKKIRVTSGSLKAMVLDEGLENTESPVKAMVDMINTIYPENEIFYFSRRQHRAYHNQKRGKFKRKQKYGNINAGLDFIAKHPEQFGMFDIVTGLDHDHVAHPDFWERMTGYFNDPNVAYVVGPQSYENALSSRIAMLAESNQSPFHIQIQAAPNRAGGPMFVGTSYAIRWSVLDQIGGIQASKTEDLKTTFAVLSRKNRETKRYWRGVYTPDVLAHGEGPATFGDFYIQQNRWAAGAMEFIRSWSYVFSLLRMWRRPMVLWHYLSIMAFYPIMGLSWLLAAANIGLQMVFGANGQIVDPAMWTLFYAWVTFMSVSLYIRMRRFNTSPFERGGTWGVLGMFMGIMTVPVFANALIKTFLFIPNKKFEVTPKGAKSTGDRPFTFRLNICWAIYYVMMIVAGYASKHNLNPINLTWSVVALAILLAPIVIWKITAPPVEADPESDDSLARLQSMLEESEIR